MRSIFFHTSRLRSVGWEGAVAICDGARVEVLQTGDCWSGCQSRGQSRRFLLDRRTLRPGTHHQCYFFIAPSARYSSSSHSSIIFAFLFRECSFIFLINPSISISSSSSDISMIFSRCESILNTAITKDFAWIDAEYCRDCGTWEYGAMVIGKESGREQALQWRPTNPTALMSSSDGLQTRLHLCWPST